MTFLKSHSEGINHSESSKHELIYTDEFKQLIRENPKILTSFSKINDTLKSKKVEEGEILEDGNLQITVFGYVDWGEHATWHRDGYYLKAEFAGEEFFVKTIPGYRHYAEEGGGVEEFQSAQKARELLEGQSDIEVIDFQLGYQDKKSETSYFVSKWVNAIKLEDYIRKIKSDDATPEEKAELPEILEKTKRLRELLKGEGFWDIEGNQNILYDPSSKKIIVFDIHSVNNLLTRQTKKTT